MSPSIYNKRKRIQRIRNQNLLLLGASMAATATFLYYHSNYHKTPQHTGKLTGKKWMEELLSGHHQRSKVNLGISSEGFRALEDLLKQKGNLQDTRYMGTTEQLGIFLYAVVTDLSIRKLAERFQRSTETIQRTYHKVMRCFLRKDLYSSIIQPVTGTTALAEIIANAFSLSSKTVLERSMEPIFQYRRLQERDLLLEIEVVVSVRTC